MPWNFDHSVVLTRLSATAINLELPLGRIKNFGYWFTNLFLSLLFKLMIIAVIIGVPTWLGLWYVSKPANEFCDSLSEISSADHIIASAEAAGYRVFDFQQQDKQR